MTLKEWISEHKRKLFDEIHGGAEPSIGEYDPEILAQCSALGKPQMGPAQVTPKSVTLEFIFSQQSGRSDIFSVKLVTPERVVYLPIPVWVTETIWQGEVSGSYHFESEARELYADFGRELEPERNERWFGPQAPKTRS